MSDDLETLRAENEALRAELEARDDMVTPGEIALSALQGLLAAGVDPSAAGVAAWHTVPHFYHGMQAYVDFAQKVQNNPAYNPEAAEQNQSDELFSNPVENSFSS